LIRYCNGRDTLRLTAAVPCENDSMRQLAKRLGFRADHTVSDARCVRYVLELASHEGQAAIDTAVQGGMTPGGASP
jgi:hypothetical protein